MSDALRQRKRRTKLERCENLVKRLALADSTLNELMPLHEEAARIMEISKEEKMLDQAKNGMVKTLRIFMCLLKKL